MKKRESRKAELSPTGGDQPTARGREPRVTLLAVVGVSPAILSETVWALANPADGGAPVTPDDVIAITTLRGQDAIGRCLQTPSPNFNGRTVWQTLREELLGGASPGEERLTLRISVIERPDPATGGTEKLADIKDRSHNMAAAEHILKAVRDHTDADDERLIASIAGGRKTMGALLHAAFSHLARPQDRLTHILVSEPYDSLYDSERNPLFFYPTQPHQSLTRDGRTFEARQARLDLADVPFAPMRLRFPDIAKIPSRFRDLVQTYVATWARDASKPALIELRRDPPRAIVDGVKVEFESERQLRVVEFILIANQRDWLVRDQVEAAELFKACHGYQPTLERVRPALRKVAQQTFEERRLTPGEPWIAGASSEDIKRPLSWLRVALRKLGCPWKIPERDLRLFPFRFSGTQ